ncbi:UNVERIFIED_CONTAM: WAT1-related protein [Sesamum latifolium]|uniref:WAT1-related protein n=1 Tax=Sesamum latifolium TaxID=2727402 RepID=A0AAW2YF66_9LAMI
MIKTSDQTCCSSFLKNCKPYIGMISLQFGYAGMNIITKISLNGGMSHYVLVVYRHAIATAVIAPFAFFFERKAQPKITFPVFMQIFVLGLLGPVIDQNFYYAGLKLTSPTFSCAMSNMLPALTFVMAIIFRMEKVDIKKVIYQAKVVGTIITVGGAMLMTLYKGPLVEMAWSKHRQSHTSGGSSSTGETSDRDCCPPTTLVCFMGTIQAIAVTFVMEHNTSAWRIGWDMNLLAAAYAGIVTSSISYYVQGLVMKMKGPVFATAFSPLMMIIVAIMGSFILAERIYLGGVIGSVIIVAGLYSVLWGKYKEEKEEKRKRKLQEIPEAIKDCNITQVNGNIQLTVETTEVLKLEAEKCPSIAIDLPLSNPPMKATDHQQV